MSNCSDRIPCKYRSSFINNRWDPEMRSLKSRICREVCCQKTLLPVKLMAATRRGFCIQRRLNPRKRISSMRRYVLRREIRSRKLYLTPNSIVYKVTRPVLFPCFGVLKKEKHILLPSVADVVVEQGYLQSLFGVYSVRIENVGVRRPPSDDVQIQGVADPDAFRKAVLTHLANMRTEAFSRQISAAEDVSSLRISHPQAAWMSPSKSLKLDSFPHSGELVLLQKLEEVGTSVKRVQTLIERQYSQASQPVD
ncbi:hypothetical protein Nepgr_015613 [Nepenthes gracilis]|uniref:DUF7642 domain-containing protein n=1 Tax=Nepenthes gracilis TaxID=150966 RepID=A0AAD3SNK1_NEPGR|nr:hypothetical protein Nepgr_015613 [Nepenthes gracilis]